MEPGDREERKLVMNVGKGKERRRKVRYQSFYALLILISVPSSLGEWRWLLLVTRDTARLLNLKEAGTDSSRIQNKLLLSGKPLTRSVG